jgi:hypothetical protein
MHRAAATQAVGEVRHTAGIDGDASEPIALVVVDLRERRLIGISWKFGPPRREICVST